MKTTQGTQQKWSSYIGGLYIENNVAAVKKLTSQNIDNLCMKRICLYYLQDNTMLYNAKITYTYVILRIKKYYICNDIYNRYIIRMI